MGDIKKWPIFNLMSPEFLSSVRVAFAYGDHVCNALIVTNTDQVYKIEYNTQRLLEFNDCHNAFSPKIIESLCGLGIKTFAFFEGPYILVLTHGGMVFSITTEYFNKNGFIIEASTPGIMNTYFDNEIVEDIACGKYHFLVLTSSGKVYESCSDYTNHNPKSASPKKVNIDKKIACISCGHSSNVIVTDDGVVYSWGDNSVGQLGLDNSICQTEPSQVTRLVGVIIKKVACGYMHVLALSNEGVLYVWGANSCRQLGICTPNDTHVPTKLDASEMEKVVDIAASCHHNISIAMGTNNRIYMWGQCLGQNIKVPTLTSVSSIHDAFAYYASSRVMHQPLIFHKNNENRVLGSLKCAFNDPNTSDLIIQVHGIPIYVHKSILMIRCQYFRTRFQKDCVAEDQGVIEENMFSYDLFKAFLQYLYTDEIDVSAENFFELLKLANHYSVNQLKKYCTQSICKHITVKNVISLYNTAITCNMKKLEDSCFKFILRNMTAVVQTPSFAELDGLVIKRFIIKAAEAGVFRT
ncbi:RCC1 and BTB domain-containing protein 1-like isoform X2 [Halictus rubicundus]|uniref:RCC1 and BTB domain-containing protein 1-like isoform X2 n=1 Tax=Halictus rubicundus TaxID=77578 RepID=UPI0040361B36